MAFVAAACQAQSVRGLVRAKAAACSLGAACALLVGSCTTGVADSCHAQLLESYGCCPFHAGDCPIPLDAVMVACPGASGTHDPLLLEDDTDDEGDDEDDGRRGPSAPDVGVL